MSDEVMLAVREYFSGLETVWEWALLFLSSTAQNLIVQGPVWWQPWVLFFGGLLVLLIGKALCSVKLLRLIGVPAIITGGLAMVPGLVAIGLAMTISMIWIMVGVPVVLYNWLIV